ncbi:MAG: TetR/AcrR family transcriptional regulator [Oscillospiraceae bacterium]|jgi:AcrR family transcriptional regulator|nr:TetR/AcrR family transcriptional regulator [Oscillospiraceae bacterium]
MPRKNNSQQTISNIIDVAARLFAEKGYEQTTIQDIVDNLGMSKGAIFHHFSSKEDIVEAVIGRHRDKLIAAAEAAAADKSVPVHERLVKTALALHVSDDTGLQMAEHLHKPQNALMHMKIERMLFDDATPVMARVVREGMEQGLFDTPCPEEVIGMILTYSNSAFDAEHMAGLTADALSRKAHNFIWTMERLLGAETGSLGGMIRLFDGLAGTGGRNGHE